MEIGEAAQRNSFHNENSLFSKALQTKKISVPPVRLKENNTEAVNAARYPLSPGFNRVKPTRVDDLACNEELVPSKPELNDSNLLCMEVLTELSGVPPINLEAELLCDETITSNPAEAPPLRKQTSRPQPQTTAEHRIY